MSMRRPKKWTYAAAFTFATSLVTLPMAIAEGKSDKAAPPKSAAVRTSTAEIFYDITALPENVAAMRLSIIEAARSGEVERLVPVLQSNELMPMLAKKRVEDPVAFFKEKSADGTGRDILAALVGILEAGYVKLNIGGTVSYVWPYFAETPLDKLTPEQQVELYRVAPAADVKTMRETGKYTYYSVGIGPDGTWHYFMRNE